MIEPEQDHDALSEVSAVREETDPGESASAIDTRRPRHDRPHADVGDAERSVNSEASTVRYKPAGLTSVFNKKTDCGDPNCDGGSCQMPASVTDIILANRGDSKTPHGMVTPWGGGVPPIYNSELRNLPSLILNSETSHL